MRNHIRELASTMNSLTGERLSKSNLLVKLYRRVISGQMSFDNFEMRIPSSRVGIWDDEIEPFILLNAADSAFWDIGANIGYFTLRAAGRADYVAAFEPEPQNYALLRENAELNGFENVDLFQIAISNESGTAKLFRNDTEGSGTHSLADNDELDGEPYTVETQTIDSLAADLGRPDFVKVDVEGAECKVLEGAPNQFERGDTDWLVEVHSPRTGKRKDRIGQHGDSVESLYRLLSRGSYEVYGYDPRSDTIEHFNVNDDEIPLYWYSTTDSNPE